MQPAVSTTVYRNVSCTTTVWLLPAVSGKCPRRPLGGVLRRSHASGRFGSEARTEPRFDFSH